MVIVDTSVWAEFLKGREDFYNRLSILLEENRVYALECVFAELLQGALNKRERQIIYSYWENLPKPGHENIFIRAGLESGKYKWFAKGVGLIDGVIVVAARETASTIWTLDKKLKRLCAKSELYE
jgi:predicted nucleic acid-binding protein